MSLMVDRSIFFAAKTSSRWLERKSKRPFTSSYCSIASTLTGPRALISFSMPWAGFQLLQDFQQVWPALSAWSKLCMNSSVICVNSLFQAIRMLFTCRFSLGCWRIHSSFFSCALVPSVLPHLRPGLPNHPAQSVSGMTPCSKSVFLARACVNWLASCSTSTVWTWASLFNQQLQLMLFYFQLSDRFSKRRASVCS